MVILDNIPYTYLIGWSNLNKWYYGVRFSKDCDPSDLFVTYFTSSKYVKEFIKINGNPDVVEIRKTFDSNESNKARIYEHKVLRRLKVVNRNDFLNKSSGLSSPHLPGRKVSEETKRKISINGKGKHSEKKSDSHRQKISCANKGKPKSPQAIANRIKANNIPNEVYAKLSSIEFFNECIINGISSERIALDLGVSSSMVLSYAKKLNIKFNRHLPLVVFNKITDPNYFKDSISNGKSAIMLSNELGIPVSAVRKYAKKLNIKFPFHPNKTH